MNDVTKIAMGIVTVAIIATIVVHGSQAATVVTAAGKAFSGSLSAAQQG